MHTCLIILNIQFYKASQHKGMPQGLSISKEISYPETQKGIREGYGKCVLLNIHLWKRKSATFDLLISFPGRGEIKEINIEGKKDDLSDQRNEYCRQYYYHEMMLSKITQWNRDFWNFPCTQTWIQKVFVVKTLYSNEVTYYVGPKFN